MFACMCICMDVYECLYHVQRTTSQSFSLNHVGPGYRAWLSCLATGPLSFHQSRCKDFNRSPDQMLPAKQVVLLKPWLFRPFINCSQRGPLRLAKIPSMQNILNWSWSQQPWDSLWIASSLTLPVDRVCLYSRVQFRKKKKATSKQ